MIISCRALATVAPSPSACTLHWCWMGNVKFCFSPLLSSLVCAMQLLFGVHMLHRVGGSTLMRTSIPMPSAEALCHGVKWVSFGSCVELDNSSSRTWSCRSKAGVYTLQTSGMYNECVPWTSSKHRYLIAGSVRAGVWSCVYRMDDAI